MIKQNKIYWFTGQPGAGKTVLSKLLIQHLEKETNNKVFHIDGDELRLIFNNTKYGREGREENIKRAQDLSKFLFSEGYDVVVSLVAPYKELRESFKETMGNNLIELYVHTTDIRGRENFHTNEYDAPTKNFIDVDTTDIQPKESLESILNQLKIWRHINYGGQPTDNPDKKYAIFIGRFQPYHYGHIELINQKLQNNTPILILVRDIEPDDKNPFTTQQTISMIEKYHQNDDVVVMKIPDIESVNFGRGVGYEINEFIPPKNIGFISATKIRNSIKENNDDWKQMVPGIIQDDIVKYLNND